MEHSQLGYAPPSMPSSPPPAPVPLYYAPPTPRNELRLIAVRQKALTYCLVGYFLPTAVILALPGEARIAAGLLAIGVSLTAAVFVFMLALTVYNPATGIVIASLALVPFLGVIPVLIVNRRATNLLRAHGIRVGLMGADSSQIPEQR